MVVDGMVVPVVTIMVVAGNHDGYGDGVGCGR